jgi:hypothetical protein
VGSGPIHAHQLAIAEEFCLPLVLRLHAVDALHAGARSAPLRPPHEDVVLVLGGLDDGDLLVVELEGLEVGDELVVST